MGEEPPWSSGRESRGDRLEIGPLWRVFAFFRRAAKEGRSRRSEISLVLLSSPPLRIDLSTASRSPSPKGEAKRKGSSSPPPSAVPIQRARAHSVRKGPSQGCVRYPLAGMRVIPPPLKGRQRERGRPLHRFMKGTGAWTGDTDCHTRYAGSQ